MFLSRAIRRSTAPCLLKGKLVGPQWLSLRPPCAIAHILLKPVHHPPAKGQSTTSRPRDAYTYPENLNIFDAGLLSVLSIGFMRIVTAVFAGYGVLWSGPSVLFSDTPLYMLPAYFILPTVPMLVTGIAFGGFVSHINVWLPRQARRSKEDLIRFASHIPPNTVLQVKSLWFAPWPHTQSLEFQDLRKLPLSWTRRTNLELQPRRGKASSALAERHPFWDWSARSWMGRFFVRKSLLRDRSRVSGVWDKMWEQIPMVGEKAATKTARSSPASARNR